MTSRQVLNRAALRYAGTDIRLAGDWDEVPQAIKDAAPEVAVACGIHKEIILWAKCIGDLAAGISPRVRSPYGSNDFDLV